MAKNKNRKPSESTRSSAAEQGTEKARSSALEAQTKIQTHAQGSPADVARKHQRRFGHN